MKREQILKKFQAKARTLAAAKRKDRYIKVVGKLKRAKLIDAPDIAKYGGPVDLEDVLWAGTLEARILEVLPALILTRPKYLRIYRMPEDLKQVVDELRMGGGDREFRGIPAKDYCKWLSNGVGGVSRLKTFRLHQEEIQRLKSLRVILGVRSDVEVLRRALQLLEKSTGESPENLG